MFFSFQYTQDSCKYQLFFRFTYTVIHSFTLLIHFTHPCIYLLIYSSYLFTYLLIHFTHPFIYLLIYSSLHLFTYLLILSQFTHQPILSSFTHSFIYYLLILTFLHSSFNSSPYCFYSSFFPFTYPFYSSLFFDFHLFFFRNSVLNYRVQGVPHHIRSSMGLNYDFRK